MTPRRPLRGLVDFSDRFTEFPAAAILGFGFLAVGLAAWIWSSTWAGLVLGVFSAIDWAMLALLPRFGRSYGPPQLPWFSLTVIRSMSALACALVSDGRGLPLFFLFQVLLSLTAAYACWVEPMRLGVTRITLRSPRLDGCPPVRVLHISDLHVERLTEREQHLMSLVRELAPDVIVVTGDFLNISYTHDSTAHRQTRELLRQLKAPGGVYAIKGSPTVDPPEVLSQLLDGLELTWLRDEMITLTYKGCCIQIAGVECSYDLDDDEKRLRAVLEGRPTDVFTLLLYHTPDVMPAAAKAGVDLFLAGHTHGGQLRLPIFGALVTASMRGKRYEMGRYREKDTTLYVCRGVGLEGKGAPRARFLCPPEIALFTLAGRDS